MRPWLLTGLLAAVLGMAIGAATASAADLGTNGDAQTPDGPSQSQAGEATTPSPVAPNYSVRQSRFSEIADRGGTLLRLLLVLATGTVLWVDRRRVDGSRPLSPRQRQIALGSLGLLALGTSQNFFVLQHTKGYHGHEMYHYYMGAKYFPELGYYDLYRCSAAAIMENHPKLKPDTYRIRDLQTHRQVVANTIVPRRPRCDGAFDAPRWASFRRDIEWFGQQLGAAKMLRALRDYGYNPSPVWTLFGRPLATLLPAESVPIVLLSRIDLVLLAVSFGAIGWAFGVKGFALAALAFGANPLSRYHWIGDAFLRYGWFASCVVGFACLRRGRAATAGSLLTLSSLLRLFPALFFLGYALHAARRVVGERRIPLETRRFVAGGAAAGALLLALAPIASGRGVSAYTDFAENMGRYSQALYWNSVGLRPLLAYTEESPEPELINGRLVETEAGRQAMRRATFERRKPVHFALVAIGLLLLWRAAGRCRGWETAALGFPLILLLAPPPAYYMCCVVPVALLAIDRPRLIAALLAALACWCIGTLVYYETPKAYAVASGVAVALGFFALFEAQRPVPSGSQDPSAPAGPMGPAAGPAITNAAGR